MKVVILAGGYGTRLSEETNSIPKPMVQIGEKPILWHIMKIYSYYGYDEFIILGGYKHYVIKEYFFNYFLHQSDVTLDLAKNEMEILSSESESWKVTILNTGLDTLTGGRIKRAQKYIGSEPFLLTYGDGLSDINITNLVEFHFNHGKAITMTAAQPEGRFGAMVIDKGSNRVDHFMEKPKGDGSWINGGFFVCNSEIFDHIKEGDQSVWEKKPLESLSSAGELFGYKHNGFWKPMDTLRDKNQLEDMWNSKTAPWKIW